MDRATTMAIVNRMQARSFLVRGQSLTDRRKQTLNLSKTGRAILATAKEAVRAHETWLKARFTDAEAQKLIELLARIHE
jgi:DNA-binding MarR family transcriptional regulator